MSKLSGVPAILGSTNSKARAADRLLARTGDIKGYDVTRPTSLQWLRNGQPIAGATTKAYLVLPHDVASEITYRFSGITPSGTEASITADPIFITDRHIEIITSLYDFYLNRTPDSVGLNHYRASLAAGRPLWEIAREIELGDEAQAK